MKISSRIYLQDKFSKNDDQHGQIVISCCCPMQVNDADQQIISMISVFVSVKDVTTCCCLSTSVGHKIIIVSFFTVLFVH